MKPVRGTIPAHIVQRVGQIAALEEALADCLPPDCCRHCRVAGINGDTLVLVVDSPNWSARIRFHGHQIVRHFQNSGKSGLRQVRIRVGPIARPEPPAPRRDQPLRLPTEAARGFAALARATEDTELKRALARLAAHGGPGGDEGG